MILRLLPTQIKTYWETIKFAAVSADLVPEKHIGNYCINLLFDLLDEKALCFISFNKEERKIKRILIVSFFIDEVTQEKIMLFRVLYSFQHGSEDEWLEESAKIYDFAKHEKCSAIAAHTKNKAIVELAIKYGFTEDGRNYRIAI